MAGVPPAETCLDFIYVFQLRRQRRALRGMDSCALIVRITSFYYRHNEHIRFKRDTDYRKTWRSSSKIQRERSSEDHFRHKVNDPHDEVGYSHPGKIANGNKENEGKNEEASNGEAVVSVIGRRSTGEDSGRDKMLDATWGGRGWLRIERE